MQINFACCAKIFICHPKKFRTKTQTKPKNENAKSFKTNFHKTISRSQKATRRMSQVCRTATPPCKSPLVIGKFAASAASFGLFESQSESESECECHCEFEFPFFESRCVFRHAPKKLHGPLHFVTIIAGVWLGITPTAETPCPAQRRRPRAPHLERHILSAEIHAQRFSQKTFRMKVNFTLADCVFLSHSFEFSFLYNFPPAGNWISQHLDPNWTASA